MSTTISVVQLLPIVNLDPLQLVVTCLCVPYYSLYSLTQGHGLFALRWMVTWLWVGSFSMTESGTNLMIVE